MAASSSSAAADKAKGREVTMGLMMGPSGKVNSAQAALDAAFDAGYSFLITQLVRYPRTSATSDEIPPPPLTSKDLVLKDLTNSHCFVGLIGEWLDLAYAGAPHPAGEEVRHSAAELRRELDWAIYLALPAILLGSLPSSSSALAHLAMLTVDAFHTIQLQYRNLWVRVAVDDEPGLAAFNTFQVLATKVSSFIGVLLELTADLPDARMLARWRGEPVKAVLIPTSVFLTNKAGFPVLSRAHQAFVRAMIEIGAQVVIQLENGTPIVDARGYQEYIEYMASRMDPSPVAGFEDELQAPLQPLQDNLESTTYETFERDAPKYTLYRKAVTAALADLPANLQSPGEPAPEPYVVMVLGGGRGPLVDASLAAAVEAGRTIKVYCVEKNPSALLTLQMRAANEWGGAVTVVGADMRDWSPEEKADIIVSELLGSFGDNELSPECLDGAQRFLKDGGISIPASYTSFAAPVSAWKLHSTLHRTTSANPSSDISLQMPYVVYLSNVHVLAPPQPAFTFEHPNPEIAAGAPRADNNRFVSLSFTVDHDAVIHGFSGYFECVLYKDIVMSINPVSHTPNMYSWFPIYHPIITPIHAKAGDSVEIHIWRKTSTSQVWFEWAFTAPYPTQIHNAKGAQSAIGL